MLEQTQSRPDTKLYVPSTPNINIILWHTQLIVCAENIKSWVFPFTFQAYILFHTLNCMCVSQESRREGWTDARSAVGFCLGSGLFGSYNSD